MKRNLLLLATAIGSGSILYKTLNQQPPTSVKNKVVIITGASSGIGKATALLFAAQGAIVVLVARRAKLLNILKDTLTPYNTPVLVIPTDITDDDQVETLVNTVMKTYGRIDILINNAGVTMGGALQNIDPTAIKKMIAINVYAPIKLTHRILPIMLQQNSGHIVNVSSMTSLIAAPGMTAYAATRAAITIFSDALHRELADTNINVSVVYPTWTRTAMLKDMNIADLQSMYLLTPLGPLHEPETPAKAILNSIFYNQPRVMMGGPQPILQAIVCRLSPSLADWTMKLYFRYLVSKAHFIKVIQNLGA